jgi:hypothetical protein
MLTMILTLNTYEFFTNSYLFIKLPFKCKEMTHMQYVTRLRNLFSIGICIFVISIRQSKMRSFPTKIGNFSSI